MELRSFEHLKTEVAVAASAAQLLQLEETVHQAMVCLPTELALTRRTKLVVEARRCPHCSCHDVVLHGKDRNKRQRLRCRGCGRTYNIMTGTPMARARKPETWNTYLRFMSDHVSVRAIVAAGIGIHHVTVWRWRHRFLQATVSDDASRLCGVIEAGEVFFRWSYKGHRGWTKGTPPVDRVARQRGSGSNADRRSVEFVPVLTALDTNNCLYQAILPSLSAIALALEGRIATPSVLCANDGAGYSDAAAKAGAELRIIPDLSSTRGLGSDCRIAAQAESPGRLGLGRVQANQRRLRELVDGRCLGVATKYLKNYLGWHRAMSRAGFGGIDLLDHALALASRRFMVT